MFWFPTIVSLIAAFIAVRAARRAFWASRGGWGGCHGHGGWHGRWHGGGLRHVLRKLDLGPGQEKVVREQVARMRELLRQERGTLKAARADVGSSFSAEALDRGALDAALQAPEQALARIRAELVTAMATIHDVLDAEQRARFAGLVGGR